MVQDKRERATPAGRGALGAVLALALLCVLVPLDAQAYVGPGAGITAIGSLLALIAGVLFAIVGFVWFPIKRMRRRRKEQQMAENVAAEKPVGEKSVGEAPKT